MGFRSPRLRLIRGNDSSAAVGRHVVRVYLIALEVEEQVVYEFLLISMPNQCEPR